jgi:hypothetical protein
MDVNEHERLSNFTLSIYKLKKKNITFIVVLSFTSTVGSKISIKLSILYCGWCGFVWLMVFNATFNNISYIVAVRVPTNFISHNVVSSTPHYERGSNSQL